LKRFKFKRGSRVQSKARFDVCQAGRSHEWTNNIVRESAVLVDVLLIDIQIIQLEGHCWRRQRGK